MNSDDTSGPPESTVRSAAKRARWWREPLLHFLVAGTILFALYRVLNTGDTAPREIVISEARVEALAENFARTWLRPPTPQELRGLVDDYIAEEVFYREAIAMGLDRDDTVIRRRLRQKMEFISEDLASAEEPTDAQLQAYLDEHAEKFVEPPRLTFEQVFFSTDRRGEDASRAAERALGQLARGRGPVDPRELGDPTLLPAGMESAGLREVANTFGSEFAEQLDAAPVGQWSGPIKSSFGMHVVRVDERAAGTRPTLAEIRPLVLREWQAARRQETNESFLAQLRSKYDVRIEGAYSALLRSPEPVVGAAQTAGGRPE